jgi:hypothetical protein
MTCGTDKSSRSEYWSYSCLAEHNRQVNGSFDADTNSFRHTLHLTLYVSNSIHASKLSNIPIIRSFSRLYKT